MRFGAILADPPWQFKVWSDRGKGRSAERHYPVMALEEIKALPVGGLAGRDCCLFLWVTNPMLPQGLEVMRAWGFAFKTVAFAWVKTNKTRPGYFTGLGYYSRSNVELCLLGTIGAPKRMNRDVRQLIVSPRREHSRKPDEVYERVERLVGGPYLELFARRRRAGWSAFGNEVDADVLLEGGKWVFRRN